MPTYNSTKWNSKLWDNWMVLAQQGDAVAYNQLLTQLQAWLAAYYRRRVPDHAQQDLIQETLMSIHAKRATYDPSQAFGPWLAAVARYRWIDYMRANSKFSTVELEETIPLQQPEKDNTAALDLEHYLNDISAEHAAIIKMVKIQQLSMAEVADKTGHSIAKLKVVVHRSMKKMMQRAQQDEQKMNTR